MIREKRIFNYSYYFKGFTVRFIQSLLQSPARVTIIGFASLIGIGTFLLLLPQASTNEDIGLVNAIFTSTSATCVTGLVVLDTGHSFTLYGQLVILILIQIGGLGIMTISTFFLLIAGRRPSLIGRIIIKDSFTHGGDIDLLSIIQDVLKFTFLIEGFGAALLFFRFLPGKAVEEALYLSFFHSISAFCNAGFSLFPDNFISYRQDWAVNIIISFLVISGGIGFLVLSELKGQLPFNRRLWQRLSLHSKLVISLTVILLFFSSFIVIIMEWENTLASLSITERCMAGFFQAVSARTAGFNTIFIGDMANETLFLLILLMFIGASPGSCGGGIKTTTLACLGILGVSRLRGKERPQVFHRTISDVSVGKSISIVMVSASVIIAATLILLITELGEVPHDLSRGKFLELLFEVVSAFGTVGLSTGVTPGLSTSGKLIITFVMFTGRLGPLAIALAASRPKTSRYFYAEENIMIG
ncbi:TrkH family potassium uptake protein [Thermodesulfobacteriota bacterium]